MAHLGLLVVFLVFGVHNISPVGASSNVSLTLNVGVLLMTNSTFPVDLRRVGPAIDMGVEEVERRYGIHFQTVVANYSVWCERARYIAPGYLSDMFYHQNISVFIGPACSYAVETSARMAEYLRVPLVTGLGDLVIRKPDEEDMFQTTAILSYNIRKLSGKYIVRNAIRIVIQMRKVRPKNSLRIRAVWSQHLLFANTLCGP